MQALLACTQQHLKVAQVAPLISDSLLQMWLCWCHAPSFAQVTRRRYGSVHPFPLNWLLTRAKRAEVLRELKLVHGWTEDRPVEAVSRGVEI